MNTMHQTFPGKPTALLAVLALTFAGPALAETSELDQLTRPASTLELGVGVVSADNKRFGQFTGDQDRSLVGLADVEVVRLDPATGTWLRLEGRDLGRASRELRLEHQRQGGWKYFAEYSEIPRDNVYDVTTSLRGAGLPTATVVNSPTAASLRPLVVGTERGRTTVGVEASLGDGLNVQATFRNEEKHGERMWGSNGQFMVEPISSTTKQVDLALNYTGKALQLTGGFYGSAFDNDFQKLQMSAASGAAFAGNASAGTYALAPSNEAQQLYLSGGYNFTDTARMSFKLSHGVALQEDAFITGVSRLASNTRTDLGGRVETAQAYVNFTAQPLDKLTLNANLRYEDRDEQTPEVQYIASSSNSTGKNQTYSHESLRGSVDAKYRLPNGYRLTAGTAYEERTRPVPQFRTVQWRDTVDEKTHRLELSRTLSATVNGGLSYIKADRGGSRPFADYTGTGAANSNTAGMLTWADRERDKIRVRADWTPVEALSLQVTADYAQDSYGGGINGIQEGHGTYLALDGTYALAEDWKLTARASRDDAVAAQRAVSGAVSIPGYTPVPASSPWTAKLRNTGGLYGLGVEGKLAGKLTVGADYQASNDRGESLLRVEGLAGDYALPVTSYRHATVKLFGKLDLSEQLGVRMDYTWDRWKIDDYTWAGWTYADGTTVTQSPKQDVQFLGVSMVYHYW